MLLVALQTFHFHMIVLRTLMNNNHMDKRNIIINSLQVNKVKELRS